MDAIQRLKQQIAEKKKLVASSSRESSNSDVQSVPFESSGSIPQVIIPDIPQFSRDEISASGSVKVPLPPPITTITEDANKKVRAFSCSLKGF